MSDEHGNASPMMDDPNTGPGHGVAHLGHTTTPESSENSPTPSYATAAEGPEYQAALNLDSVSAKLQDVHVNDQPAGSVAQAGTQILKTRPIQAEADILRYRPG